MSARRHRLYSDMASLWPLVSPPSDYAHEAAAVHRLLTRVQPALRRRGDDRPTLLELGAGGGHLLHHLTDHFGITAVDLSPAMLRLSRRLNPNVSHHLGDMRSVRLRRRFDVVLVHDAVSYMLTPTDLTRLFRTARAHLKPGGQLVLMPDYIRDTFPGHDLAHDRHADGNKDITTVSLVHDPDPDDSTFELVMMFLIRSTKARGGRTRTVIDRHTCGLFPLQTWQRLLKKAGFRARLFTCGTGGVWRESRANEKTARREGGVLWLASLSS